MSIPWVFLFYSAEKQWEEPSRTHKLSSGWVSKRKICTVVVFRSRHTGYRSTALCHYWSRGPGKPQLMSRDGIPANRNCEIELWTRESAYVQKVTRRNRGNLHGPSIYVVSLNNDVICICDLEVSTTTSPHTSLKHRTGWIPNSTLSSTVIFQDISDRVADL